MTSSDSQVLVKTFLDYLAIQRRLSKNTLIGYQHDLEVLVHCSGAKSFAELTTHDIRHFMRLLHSAGTQPRSLARRLSSWRSFYRFLMQKWGYAQNPCVGVRTPKIQRALPSVLSPDQSNQLLDFIAESAWEKRDKAIYELFYSSGLRLSELVNANVIDMDLHEGLIRVTGKGNKIRIVPVGKKAIDALTEWLPVRAQLCIVDEPAIFISRLKRRLTQRAIQYSLKSYGVTRNIPQNLHPHVLRHSFASHLLQSSGDLRAVQELLGHVNITSTQVYTHLNFQHLSQAYDLAHPRAKKK